MGHVAAQEGRTSPIARVVLYAGLGDLAAAFEWLETAVKVRCDLVWLTRGFPGVDPLREDPRYADLCQRMGVGGWCCE